MSSGRPTLLGVPFDASSSFLRGATYAPPLIRAALHAASANLWTETRHDLSIPGAFDDLGDVALGSDPQESIESAVRALMDRDRRPVVLGGDQSITYPVLRAVRAKHTPLSILHFDAHNDLYDSYEGDPLSHACPFARIMENGLCDQLVQVGIRTTNGLQRSQAARFGVDIIDMVRWGAGARPVLQHPVYISIDVDVLEPGLAPGVSHREPGGLSVRDVIAQLHAIDVPIVGADLVEFNPLRDVGDVTAMVCGKLLRELLGVMQ